MKQKQQLAILAVLLVIAGVVWYYARTEATSSSGPFSVTQNYQPLAVENPQLHRESLEHARKTEYKTAGRNIFSAVAPLPVVTPTRKVADARKNDFVGPKPPPPIPTPPPPTLPAKFFGYGTVPNGVGRRAFLLDGEDVYVVAEGEVLLNRFRIIKVGNASLEFEELSSGRRGTAPLEEQAAGQSSGAGPAA